MNTKKLDSYYLHEQEWDSYSQLIDQFEWQTPDSFNIANYTCGRWADDKDRVAFTSDSQGGCKRTFTYNQIDAITDQLAVYLNRQGIEEGARIGVNLPQKPEAAMAHIAAWKLGAVSVPLSTSFGPDGLEYRLGDCNADACLVDESNIDSFRSMNDGCGTINTVLTVGELDHQDNECDFWEALDSCEPDFENVETEPDQDAIIMYTSGTTGSPKGVLHGHQLLLGHLPEFVVVNNNLNIGEEEVYWSPSEWTWIATLFDMVFPAMFFGKTILVYYNKKFRPRTAYELIDEYSITKFLAPPTALRMMMNLKSPNEEYEVTSVDTIVSGGESVGQNIKNWAADIFGEVAVNENYGQTEANGIIGECTALDVVQKGQMGCPTPGHDVRILDPDTLEEVPPGTIGEIALQYNDDPICFKEYWNRPKLTGNKIQEGWLLTGDLGTYNDDGFFTFNSRKDDVIISSGYRIGPEEIEETLTTHNAVVDSGVIGIPDEERGEIPKAFIVLADKYNESESLKAELQSYVKSRLASYEYPREIEFIKELPKTITGKTQRKDLRKRENAE